jgi:hypothetical protein
VAKVRHKYFLEFQVKARTEILKSLAAANQLHLQAPPVARAGTDLAI